MNRDQRNRILRAAERRRPFEIRDELGDMPLGDVKRRRGDALLLWVVLDQEVTFREEIEKRGLANRQVRYGRRSS